MEEISIRVTSTYTPDFRPAVGGSHGSGYDHPSLSEIHLNWLIVALGL